MKKSWIYSLTAILILAVLGYFLWPMAFTVVPIAQVEQLKASEAFDPVTFVDGIWSTQLLPAFSENAVDLPTVLDKFEPDASGQVAKDALIPVAKEHGLITVGEAHVYMVKGTGTVTKVDTSKSTGFIEVKVDGYDGPIPVRLYIGTRIPSDESSVRDAVGFLTFGDFKEQTEYGKVASEINKRINTEVLSKLPKDQLEAKQISFSGAFTVRTFNLITINMQQINIVPVTIEVQ